MIFRKWLKRKQRVDPCAGRVIGSAPDPRADYLPENRPVSTQAAAELRRMVLGK